MKVREKNSRIRNVSCRRQQTYKYTNLGRMTSGELFTNLAYNNAALYIAEKLCEINVMF